MNENCSFTFLWLRIGLLKKRLLLFIYALIFIIMVGIVFLLFTIHEEQLNKAGCVMNLLINEPTTPSPTNLVVFILVRDTTLREILRNNRVKKINHIGSIFADLDAHGAIILTTKNDSVFNIVYCIDHHRIKNRLEMEKANQTNFYYEIIDYTGKTWVIKPCIAKLTPASPDKK